MTTPRVPKRKIKDWLALVTSRHVSHIKAKCVQSRICFRNAPFCWVLCTFLVSVCVLFVCLLFIYLACFCLLMCTVLINSVKYREEIVQPSLGFFFYSCLPVVTVLLFSFGHDFKMSRKH